MTLTLVGKPDCHLCHVMSDVVREVVGDRLALVEADVRSKPEWQIYRLEIPVLLLDGQEVARHRITPDDLKARLLSLGVSL